MIWTLRIECVTGRYLEDEWVRLVEVDSASSLADLHDLIQDAARFDRDHLYEFCMGRNYRQRAAIFNDLEDDFEENEGCDVTLEELFPLPKNMKLFYHFDFGDDWRFEIRRMRNKPKEPEAGVRYPRVIEKKGPKLHQYGGH
jgi:hypothetical protein